MISVSDRDFRDVRMLLRELSLKTAENTREKNVRRKALLLARKFERKTKKN